MERQSGNFYWNDDNIFSGVISLILDNCIFAKFKIHSGLEEEEGFIYSSRIPGYDPERKLKDQYKIGEEVNVKILNIVEDPFSASLEITKFPKRQLV